MSQVTISMDNDTRTLLDKMAQKIGLSRSGYLRMLVKKEIIHEEGK